MKKAMKGFTLVEIMIVVAIIAILAAVAIPNFVKYRKQSQATACIANLKQIQAAVEQYKLAGGAAGEDGSVPLTKLVGKDKYIKNTLYCPSDKEAENPYTTGTDDTNPECNIGKGFEEPYTHKLPEVAE